MPHPTPVAKRTWVLERLYAYTANEVWVWLRGPAPGDVPVQFDGRLTAGGLVPTGPRDWPAGAHAALTHALVDLPFLADLFRDRADAIRTAGGTCPATEAIPGRGHCELLAAVCDLPEPAARATALAMLTGAAPATAAEVLVAASSAAA